MKNPFSQQSQFELFPRAPGSKPHKPKMSFFNCSITLSFENMIVLSIIFVMGMVVAFSFGVEQGKRVYQKIVQKEPMTTIGDRMQHIGIQEERGDAAGDVLQEKDMLEEASVAYTEKVSANETQNAAMIEKKVDKTPSLEKIHTIQVASFKQENRADQEAGNLQQLGYDAFTAKKGSYFIVCVGRFDESREARPLLKALKKKYSDCYVRSL